MAEPIIVSFECYHGTGCRRVMPIRNSVAGFIGVQATLRYPIFPLFSPLLSNCLHHGANVIFLLSFLDTVDFIRNEAVCSSEKTSTPGWGPILMSYEAIRLNFNRDLHSSIPNEGIVDASWEIPS